MSPLEKLKIQKQLLDVRQSIQSATKPLEKMALIQRRMQLHKQLGINSAVSLLAAAKTPTEAYSAVMTVGEKLLAKLGISVLSADSLKGAYKAKVQMLVDDPLFTSAISQDWRGQRSEEEIRTIAQEMADNDLEYAYNSRNIGRATYAQLQVVNQSVHTEIGAVITEYVQGLIGSSSITQAQAAAYARTIEISPSATKKLTSQRKGDYRGKKAAIPKLREDMAQLYRLTNGAVGVDMFVKTKDDRASYWNDYVDNKSAINIGSGLTKGVLWHELSHSIEYRHPEVLEATKGFLIERLAEARANGRGICRLKTIYPGSKFGEDEVAIEDSAFSHYVTKLYRKDLKLPTSPQNICSSEIISMGIESLSNPGAAGRLVAKDPRHLAFILGVIEEMRKKA